LQTTYGQPDGYSPERRTYATGPKLVPGAVERESGGGADERRALRCHERFRSRASSGSTRSRSWRSTPFDKPGREAWVKGGPTLRRKQAVPVADAEAAGARTGDMPPEDSAEYGRVSG